MTAFRTAVSIAILWRAERSRLLFRDGNGVAFAAALMSARTLRLFLKAAHLMPAYNAIGPTVITLETELGAIDGMIIAAAIRLGCTERVVSIELLDDAGAAIASCHRAPDALDGELAGDLAA